MTTTLPSTPAVAVRKRYTLAKAQDWAAQITQQIAPFCHRIEVAGSIRRGEETIGDINLIVLPKDRAGLRARVLHSKPEVIVDNEAALVVKLANGVCVDLWFAEASYRTSTLSSPNGSNFGALLLFRTGSREHNAWLQRRASSQGMRWNTQWGIYSEGRLVAADSESEIFEALQLPYADPHDRAPR